MNSQKGESDMDETESALDPTGSIQNLKIDKFRQALIVHDGNVSAAADDLEISRDTAYRWMKKHKSLKRLKNELKKEKRNRKKYGYDYQDDSEEED